MQSLTERGLGCKFIFFIRCCGFHSLASIPSLILYILYFADNALSKSESTKRFWLFIIVQKYISFSETYTMSTNIVVKKHQVLRKKGEKISFRSF